MPALVLYLRPQAQRPAVIDDLLDMVAAGQQAAVDAAIVMLTDLHAHGAGSSYAKKLKALPIWELKTHARGGIKGGTRVYFFFRPTGEIVIASAETKEGDAPGPALKTALQAWKADS
ncbi:type II toxin-antitoxin system RelE/ParE family toxin [Deinococcus budaensis]|uniref:Addiction module toxin RelE n=1 Tax=Deinococcus budaensis TaxID=1665626 RepID=A0A7W8GFE8_9DEIO|nr:type II toxin-antitoxin system RelE/ParE family toxin [Deinococcus budaensis]MBB5234478.1 hypothetical protein [Deinococcus budaensis]